MRPSYIWVIKFGPCHVLFTNVSQTCNIITLKAPLPKFKFSYFIPPCNQFVPTVCTLLLRLPFFKFFFYGG